MIDSQALQWPANTRSEYVLPFRLGSKDAHDEDDDGDADDQADDENVRRRR